jgi:hypothetical protein
MSTLGAVWLAVAALSAALFFAIAVVVTWRGASDLRDLLKGARRHREDPGKGA